MAPELGVTEHSLIADGTLCAILLANVLNIISFVSTTWAIPEGKGAGHSGYGLWRFCEVEGKTTTCGSMVSGAAIPSWLRASQAMMAIAFSCMAFSMLTQLGYICCNAFSARKNVVLVLIASSAAAVVFAVIGIIVYAVEMPKYVRTIGFTGIRLGWAIILAIVAVVLTTIAILAAIAEVRFNPKLDARGQNIILEEVLPDDSPTQPTLPPARSVSRY